MSKSSRLNISYRGRTILPTITQLQPTPDLSNPLYIREGNPMLRPEFNNTLTLNFTSFNIANFNFISANVNVGNSINKIVNSIDSSGSPGVQRIRPINADGSFNMFSYLVYGIPLKNKLQGSNLNFSISATYNIQNGRLYGKDNRTKTLMLMQGISSNLDFNSLNIFFNAGLTYNRASYSLNRQFNTDYFAQNCGAGITYSFFKNYTLSVDFDYYNNNSNSGFNTSIFLLNSGISRAIFKGKNGEIKLSINDMLNQNRSFTRLIGDNYIEDNTSLVLKRYLLLSFIYRFNKQGAMPADSDGLPKQFKRQIDQLRISN
jgi:hypothetical protein